MAIELVLVKQNEETFLFQAPKWFVDEGETVVVEGDKTGKVVKVIDYIYTDDKHFDFIVMCAGAKTPLPKVIGKLMFTECRYEEEEA